MTVNVDRPSVQHNLPRVGERVLGVFIDVIDWDGAVGRICAWARTRSSRFVCLCNVHSVVTAGHDPALRTALDAASLATPDGMPVAWTLRRAGHSRQQRIDGPDLMWRLCEGAEEQGIGIFLFGSRPETLQLLVQRLQAAFPRIRLAGMRSPPFGVFDDEANAAFCAEINASGAGLVFVGLGCPRQEKWMAEHSARLNAVLVGVGAAFDYHAGTLPRAPAWMRRNGLEWFYRLVMEPRRLWRRYLVTNTEFIIRVLPAVLRRHNGTRGNSPGP